jgi:hypothetical protein
MSRRKLRSQSTVAERCRELREEVQTALARLRDGAGDPETVESVWRGEGLGTLLWGLQLAELPPYDEPFDLEPLLGLEPGEGAIRSAQELELERESARLWHWRARTSELQAAGRLELPARYASLDQLVAATAMRGYEQGALPSPMRGDFRAFGKVYRHLTPEQQAEAHSIAVERHHALNWLCGHGTSWHDVPLDT